MDSAGRHHLHFETLAQTYVILGKYQLTNSEFFIKTEDVNLSSDTRKFLVVNKDTWSLYLLSQKVPMILKDGH